MGKYLITGAAGTGKTTIIEELARRGFAAYSTDEIPEATQFQDLRTGKIVPKPEGAIDFTRYGWHWQEKGLKQLLASADPVFIAAAVSNLIKFHHLFDAVFVLTIDEATLRHRLATRTTKDYGKHPDDLAYVLSSYQSEKRALIEQAGAIPIDSTEPLGQVVGKILQHARATV